MNNAYLKDNKNKNEKILFFFKKIYLFYFILFYLFYLIISKLNILFKNLMKFFKFKYLIKYRE